MTSRKLALLAIIATVVLAVGVTMAPERIWSNLLLVGFYLTTLGLGGALFIALNYVCGASWNIAFRRIPEAMAILLAPAGLGLLAVLTVRREQYAWHAHGDAGTFWFKELWATPSFWMLRAVVYLVLWILFSRVLVAVSRRQDRSGSLRLSHLNKRLAAFFLVIYAVTFSLASIDWIMLLEPLWFSTIWGVYHFAGMLQATLAAIVILGLLLRKRGPMQGAFTDDHLHDLGKLSLGFSCFDLVYQHPRGNVLLHAKSAGALGTSDGAQYRTQLACSLLDSFAPCLQAKRKRDDESGRGCAHRPLGRPLRHDFSVHPWPNPHVWHLGGGRHGATHRSIRLALSPNICQSRLYPPAIHC